MLSLLSRPTHRADVSWRAWDPRWYQEISGSRADAGITVVPERALGVAVLYRALSVIAHSIASVPLVVQKVLPNDGKERAKSHPAYKLLHHRPNNFMTSFRWRFLMVVQKYLYGNHYSEIFPGQGGIGQLVPLSPTTTRVVDQLSDGRLRYETRDMTKAGFAPARYLLSDEVLHIRGFSMDGKVGIPITNIAKNAIAMALIAERHGSMFLKRGARFAGVLSTEARLDDETKRKNQAEWQASFSGPDASGSTPLLTGTMKYTPISSNNKDSQWLELRDFQVQDVLRFIPVPGVLCGYPDKTTTYASAEQFFLNYVVHSVQPEAIGIEQELDVSVVLGAPDEYFSQFILDGLLRGDIKTRYAAHQIAVQTGWKTRNEVRLQEDMNKGPEALDEFIKPMNMDTVGDDPDGEDVETRRRSDPTDPARNDDDEDEGRRDEASDDARVARLRTIAERAAARLVRLEVAAIAGSSSGQRGAAKRFAGNADGWRGWLAQFYADHAERIRSELGATEESAARYCAAQKISLEKGIPKNFEPASIGAMLALMEA